MALSQVFKNEPACFHGCSIVPSNENTLDVLCIVIQHQLGNRHEQTKVGLLVFIVVAVRWRADPPLAPAC